MSQSKILACSVTALLLTFTAADAHIACDGDYQVVEGHEIYTPYCGDRTIAATARADGFSVSNREVRNNPAAKDGVCRWLRGDGSLRPDCY